MMTEPPNPFASARRVGGPLGRLQGSLFVSASLSDEALRALWRFRLTHMALKPHVDPEEDFASFATLVRSGLTTLAVRDTHGVLRASTNLILQPRVQDGRRFIYMLLEYTYADPSHRGGFGVLAVGLLGLVHVLTRWPGTPIFIGGAGYPGGFLMLCQFLDPIWLWGDPGMDPWERGVFEQLASECPGWDPTTGVVTMKTRPLHPRTHPPRDPHRRRCIERYLATCPRWAEGYTAFSLARCSPATLTALPRGVLRRL